MELMPWMHPEQTLSMQSLSSMIEVAPLSLNNHQLPASIFAKLTKHTFGIL